MIRPTASSPPAWGCRVAPRPGEGGIVHREHVRSRPARIAMHVLSPPDTWIWVAPTRPRGVRLPFEYNRPSAIRGRQPTDRSGASAASPAAPRSAPLRHPDRGDPAVTPPTQPLNLAPNAAYDPCGGRRRPRGVAPCRELSARRTLKGPRTVTRALPLCDQRPEYPVTAPPPRSRRIGVEVKHHRTRPRHGETVHSVQAGGARNACAGSSTPLYAR